MRKISNSKIYLLKRGINIIMKAKTFISRAYFCNSLQLNLSEFGSENPTEKCIKRLMKDAKSEFNKNHVELFVIYTYEYAQIMLKDYSSKFSKRTFTKCC